MILTIKLTSDRSTVRVYRPTSELHLNVYISTDNRTISQSASICHTFMHFLYAR